MVSGLFMYNYYKIKGKEAKRVEWLLSNMLSKQIGTEILREGATRMRAYERVSVVFADFKGFSEITKDMSGDDMMDELNDCFTGFDEIIEKYQLDRIKTIGDSYMCAGGIPDPNYSNPIDIILAGLAMQRFMKQRYEERNGHYWQCRLGINVGEVQAGVIGKAKFTYDL